MRDGNRRVELVRLHNTSISLRDTKTRQVNTATAVPRARGTHMRKLHVSTPLHEVHSKGEPILHTHVCTCMMKVVPQRRAYACGPISSIFSPQGMQRSTAQHSREWSRLAFLVSPWAMQPSTSYRATPPSSRHHTTHQNGPGHIVEHLPYVACHRPLRWLLHPPPVLRHVHVRGLALCRVRVIPESFERLGHRQRPSGGRC